VLVVQPAERRARRTIRRNASTNGTLCGGFDPLEDEVEAERQRRAALAYDQQALRAKLLGLETEIILLQAGRS